MSNSVKIWCVVIFAMFIGGAVAFWTNGTTTTAAIEANHTDEMSRGIVESQDVVVAHIEAKNEIVRTEVRTIYVETKSKVMALPPDGVADGLNAELALWRGMESGSGGVDDH